ncbi:hypothetical protein IFM89_011104 [Coptis chinensis]|uniref:non-specific serine/threonine protein kinase n=1 Tax=Coptis chinensis TaxID=261450 RepID=A0A835INC2_9MAGN|nr:hypothetical protein IFM89_011104 [Coptis chinensis]
MAGDEKLYVVITVVVCSFIFISVMVLVLCVYKRKRKVLAKNNSTSTRTTTFVPLVTKEITEIKGGGDHHDHQLEKEVDVMKEKENGVDEKVGSNNVSGGSGSLKSLKSSCSVSSQDVSLGWGRWYSYKELEIATSGFANESVIGEGGYGVVYRGVMPDCSVIAVKNLFNNKGQAEQEFKVEVEAIGKVRHKNLVGLVGYCVEGVQRMLVYEYVDNGNLEQWLHGDVGPSSPLTWDVRMKIATGTAKGLAYLHEGLEPKVVHRDIKSSNILLDKKWKPKVSDFGLAKLLGSDASYVTTRVMGTFGYVAPEYVSSGRLTEGSDVYSFGVLLMEIISGRRPVDYARPAVEVNLVDWFKMMVANRRSEEVLDPRIEVHPSPRALKRILLVCLRCIDWNASKRPKMGQVVHMLDADEFPFRSEHWSAQDGAHPSPRARAGVSDGTPTPSLSKAVEGR